MAFAVASAFFGLLGPVVVWATWTTLTQNRIVRELEAANDVDSVAVLGGSDASSPVRLTATVAGRTVVIEAVVRGGMKLWHLHVTRAAPGPEYTIVDAGWVSVAKSAKERPRDAFSLCAAYALHVEKRFAAEAYVELRRPLVVSMLEAQARSHHKLLQVVTSTTEAFFEVTRDELKSHEALSVVRRVVRLLDGLEGHVPPARQLPPSPAQGKSGTTNSGAPVGISSGVTFRS